MLGQLIKLYSRIPLLAAQKVGSFTGLFAWYLGAEERHIAQINLAHCFPRMDPAERQRLARRSLQENGKLLAELPLIWLQPAARFASKVFAVETMNEISRIKQTGRGLILIVPHMGNWEVGLHQVAQEIQMTVLYRPPRQRWLSDIMTHGRQATGAKTAPTDASGIKQLLSALRKGEGIAILPDQTPKKKGDSAALFAPFFGQPAYTMTLASRLAAKTGAEVRAIYLERLPHGQGFQTHLKSVDDAIYDNSLEKSISAVNAAVEACVRECPHQYQWSYKRFRVQPDGQASLYKQPK